MNQALLQKAIDHHQNGDLEQAKNLYEQLLREDADSHEAMFGIGMIAAQQKQFDVAIEWLEQAIAIAPNVGKYQLNLANIFLEKNQFEDAKKYYEQVVALDKKNAEAWNNLANLYVKLTDLEQALKYYVKAVHIRPDYIDAHYNLGLLLMKLQKIPEAIIQFKNVIELFPDAFNANYQLANLYLIQDKLDDAEKHYQKLLEIDPEFSLALNNLGVIALRKNKGQLAIDYFAKAYAFDSKNYEALNNLAATFLQHDRTENAVTHYDQYLKIFPDDLEANFNMGVAQMTQGHLQEAISYFKKILDKQPDNVNAMINIGSIYLKLEQRDVAAQYFAQAQQLQPDNTMIHYMLDAIAGKTEFAQAPDDYVKNLFDHYALQFEQHLKHLSYQAPSLLRQQIVKLFTPQEKQWTILDLGCGTGLVGIEFQHYAKELIGVDISDKMINEAKHKNVYNQLIVSSIDDYFSTNKTKFDLVIAADVFCYFGNLSSVFKQIASHLNNDGIVAFTVEKNSDESTHFKLQGSARFAHSKHYIEELALANQLKIQKLEEVSYRKQEQHDVKSFLVVMQK